MTREEVKRLLPIFQAFADGKDIQFRNPDGRVNPNWIDDNEMSHFEIYEYRIKPEPREFWIRSPYESGVTYALTEEEYESGEWENENIIKVREVLDDE